MNIYLSLYIYIRRPAGREPGGRPRPAASRGWTTQCDALLCYVIRYYAILCYTILQHNIL